MKQIYILALLLTFSFLHLKAQTLSAGDIAFIGLNSDTQEGYSFITLTYIPENEKIFFSDKGIKSATSNGPTTEGTYLFTTPVGGIPCGTVISFQETSTDVLTISGISGSTMTLQEGSFNLGGGDQIYAYQTVGDLISTTPTNTTFIAAIMYDYDAICVDSVTFWTQSACVSSTSESVIPPGLTNGENAISMTPTGPEIDNMRYTGTLTGTAADLRTSINDFTNWETNNGPSAAPIYDISPSGYSTPSVDCSTLSINTFSLDNNVKIYPNPSANFITITGLKTKENYNIYNVLGSNVLKGKISSKEKIDIINLTKGLYFLKFENGVTIKLIKE